MRRALALTCLLLITACGERKTGVYDGGRTIVCNPIEDCITMAYKIETNIWLGYVLNAETAGWTEEVSPAGANDLLGVWAIAHNDIYTCGQSQKIQHWNGTTWAEVDDVGGNALYTLWGADASNIWAVGVGDTVRYYNGSTWANRATGSGQTLYGVFGVSATTLWAVGNNGTIRKTTNGGSSWINQDNGTGALNAIWMADSSEGWVVGDGGVVRHTTNGGSTWPTESSGTTEGLLGVWGFSNSDVFAVGANGTIIHWDGVAWSAQTSGTSEWLRAIWGSHGNRVYAVGGTFSSNYLILIYDGISWSQDTSAGANQARAIHGVLGSSIRVAVEGDGVDNSITLSRQFETQGTFSVPISLSQQPERDGTVTLTRTAPSGTSVSVNIMGSHTGAFSGEEQYIDTFTGTSYIITEKFRYYKFNFTLTGTADVSPYVDRLQVSFPG